MFIATMTMISRHTARHAGQSWSSVPCKNDVITALPWTDRWMARPSSMKMMLQMVLLETTAEISHVLRRHWFASLKSNREEDSALDDGSFGLHRTFSGRGPRPLGFSSVYPLSSRNSWSCTYPTFQSSSTHSFRNLKQSAMLKQWSL